LCERGGTNREVAAVTLISSVPGGITQMVTDVVALSSNRLM
jgi:hypothetical protein